MGSRFETEDEEPLNKAKIAPYTEAVLKLRRWKVDQPVLLKLSPAAAKKRREFYNQIEKELAPGNSLEDVRDIANRSISLTARIAGIFAALDAASQDDSDIKLSPITAEQWLRAQALEEYFLAQLIDMQRTETSGKTYLLQKTARWLLKKIKEQKGNEPLFVYEGTMRNKIRGLTSEILKEIIPQLETKKWIRKGEANPKGGYKYEVNPNIRIFDYEN